jgi:hypothetical protein
MILRATLCIIACLIGALVGLLMPSMTWRKITRARMAVTPADMAARITAARITAAIVADRSWEEQAAALSLEDRQELADLTPFDTQYNAAYTWDLIALRWKQDGGDYVGPRAILPIQKAREAFHARSYAGLKVTTLDKLRIVSGFIELPPGASFGKPYGGEDAVWDVYYKPRFPAMVGEIVRGHVGGVYDNHDDFTSRSFISVPSKGFRNNILGSSGDAVTVYLVPHDMSEPVTKADPALRPYAEYREEREKDLAQRGPAPHASVAKPRDGYFQIEEGRLEQWSKGSWNIVDEMPAERAAYNCVIEWSETGSDAGTLWCFEQPGYWKISRLSLFGFARTSRNLMETGPVLRSDMEAQIRGYVTRAGPLSAQYAGCPIISDEPWPQGVYDENTVMGVAGDYEEMRKYYGWRKQ